MNTNWDIPIPNNIKEIKHPTINENENENEKNHIKPLPAPNDNTENTNIENNKNENEENGFTPISIKDFISSCELEYAANPNNVKVRTNLEFLYIQNGEYEKALNMLETLPELSVAPTQDEVMEKLLLLGLYYKIGENSKAKSLLNEIRNSFSALFNLEVPVIKFCKKVEGFGEYEELEAVEFKPSKVVGVYCEIENFTCKKMATKYFEIKLDIEAGIYRKDSNEKVYINNFNFSKIVNKQINKTYLLFKTTLPMTKGEYYIKLALTDAFQNDKKAYKVVYFNVK